MARGPVEGPEYCLHARATGPRSRARASICLIPLCIYGKVTPISARSAWGRVTASVGLGVDKSLGAGLGVGTALVVAGFVGSAALFPPRSPEPALSQDAALEAPVSPETAADAAAPTAEDPAVPAASPDGAGSAALDAPPEAPAVAPIDAVQEPEPPAAAAEFSPPSDAAEHAPASAESAQPAAPMDAAEVVVPEFEPDVTPIEPMPGHASAEDDTLPLRPQPDPTPPTAPTARLPSGILPAPRDDGARVLPQVLPPAPAASEAEAEAPVTAPPSEVAPALRAQPAGTRPDVPMSRLPQIGGIDLLPVPSGDVLPPREAMVTALERHSLYAGKSNAARMAVILADPGLPMSMRQALAELDLPLTVALNPLDSSASDAAQLYRDAGKEVLILATSIPERATASDLDVTFSAFFASVPTAVGVIDLPEGGFARNAGLLGLVLPLLAQDGHGLVTFAGGLAQSARAARAAGIAQAEVFRSLDTGDESAFTIRRFLDRAVFQASQMGQVIVFGDASNAATMEALAMWIAAGPPDQVAVVPVSGILLNAP
ncbi:MAG: hypothetical protein EA339_13230 [Rhodobacteraceae bacterium]|nr:MAG: hypothetical protein EA339_13230 [Paracoccaceae bacterium]